jgi:hypothetical protein
MGVKAAEAAKTLGASVVIVDPNSLCLARESADVVLSDTPSIDPHLGGKTQLLPGDAISTLLELMVNDPPDLVVPAGGGHFAARLAMEYARKRGKSLAPDPLLMERLADFLPTEVVQLRDVSNALLITSHMPSGFVCVIGCHRPPRCPVTGRKIHPPMNEILNKALSYADRSTLLVTQEMGEVGVLASSDLNAMFETIDDLYNRETYGVATTCSCHGVTNLFSVVGDI